MRDLPAAFVERIKTQFGDQADRMIQSLNLPAESSVRINRNKPADLQLGFSGKVEWCDDGYFLKNRPVYTLDPLFHAGCYYPQESSSMFLSFTLKQIFGQNKKLTCLDFCAAPGGKSLIVSDFIGEEGKLISNEINRTRNSILREVITKWGCRNVAVTSSPASAFSSLKGFFDCVLIDAPCSGEGMFRKDHESRNEWSLAAVEVCAKSQREIIQELKDTVAPGGFLIYSTCTFSQKENEGSCKEIVSTGNFESVRLTEIPSAGISEITGDRYFAYQFLPHRVRGEGFFISVFKRSNNVERYSGKSQKIFQEPTKIENYILKKFAMLNSSIIKDRNDQLWVGPFNTVELNLLSGKLYFTMPGVSVGRIIREELIPDHPMALSGFETEFGSVELDYDQAMSFLRGEAINSVAQIGWRCVTFRGHRLGWIKCMGGRSNNYYPKEYRIRIKNPGH